MAKRNSKSAIEVLTPSTTQIPNSEVFGTDTEVVTLISKNPTKGGGVEMEVVVLDRTVEEFSDTAHTLELLEKIGEQQKATWRAEREEFAAKYGIPTELNPEQPFANDTDDSYLIPSTELTTSFYSEVKMELSQAKIVTVKQILLAKEVSTVDATRFTDRFKEVRDAVWALNKKGEREYVIVKEGKVAVLVWRIK